MLREIVFITTILLFEGSSLILKDKPNKTLTIVSENSLDNNDDFETEDNIEELFLNYSSPFGNGTAHDPLNSGMQPVYFDWRDKDSVSPVKNQGHCSACWAFSTIANIESQLKIKLGRKEILSEQFLLDCVVDNNGCNSASLLKTFAYIVANFHGVLRLKDYHQYEGKQRTCTWKGTPSPVPVIGFKRIQRDEEIMAEYIYQYGPLSAAINSKAMDNYKGNHIDEPSEDVCSSHPEKLDHAILIVGYNVFVSDKGETVPYWIIKNSWGEEWGDNGFYYLVRGRNACGIANDVSIAFVN